MKRELEDDEELEVVINEIVTIANARDNRGQYIEPLLTEGNPMILTFFHAKDALLNVLMNKPVIFLNLLQTNTTMATFWKRFEKNIWVLLLERLIELEMGKKAVEIYPFFLIEHIATYGLETALSLPMGGPSFVTHYLELGFRLANPTGYYFQEYNKFDVITRKFVDLLLFIIKHKSRPWLNVTAELLEYLNLLIHPYNEPYIACLKNGFLTDQPNISNKFVFDIVALRRRLHDIIIRTPYNGEHTNYLADSLDRLTLHYPKGDTLRENSFLLTKESTQKYRDQLYNEKDGLYNTPEKQRELFLSTLRATGKTSLDVIEKYGYKKLECFLCRKDSTHANLLHSLSFCGTGCHSEYLNSFASNLS